MAKKQKPIVLITGYLGAGKTTLMQKLLLKEDRPITLIVNDMGTVNTDAELLRRGRNRVAQVQMVEMQNGCICCTLRDEFIAQVERLAQDPAIEAVLWKPPASASRLPSPRPSWGGSGRIRRPRFI